MQVKELKTAPVTTPQCEGKIVGAQPSYRKAGGDQCFRKSQYEINGKHYCAFHAGRIALEMLMAKQTPQNENP